MRNKFFSIGQNRSPWAERRAVSTAPRTRVSILCFPGRALWRCQPQQNEWCVICLDTCDLRDSLTDMCLPQSSREGLVCRRMACNYIALLADFKEPHGWNKGGLRAAYNTVTMGHMKPQSPQGLSAWTNAIKHQIHPLL